MAPLELFTDGSVHPPSRIGFGAYLALSDQAGEHEVQLRRFENTASSQLEIETLIWALESLQPEAAIVYTDSQTIIGLPGRRARFEERNYLTAQNKPVRHAALYRKFFQLTDQINCTFVKVKGHSTSDQKTDIDHLFKRVDRASRQALRDHIR